MSKDDREIRKDQRRKRRMQLKTTIGKHTGRHKNWDDLPGKFKVYCTNTGALKHAR